MQSQQQPFANYPVDQAVYGQPVGQPMQQNQNQMNINYQQPGVYPQQIQMMGYQGQNFIITNQVPYPGQPSGQFQPIIQTAVLTPYSVIENHEQAITAFWKNFSILLPIYYILNIACIFVQYFCCGSLAAGKMWIISISLSFFSLLFVKQVNRRGKISFLYPSAFSFLISLGLLIAACVSALTYPPILEITIYGYTISQKAGHCYHYSDEETDPYQDYGNNKVQLGCLILYCVFMFSASFQIILFPTRLLAYFQFLKKSYAQIHNSRPNVIAPIQM